MLLGTISLVLLKAGSRSSGPRRPRGPGVPAARQPGDPEARWPSPGFPQFFLSSGTFKVWFENNLHRSIMKVLYRFL